MNGSFTQTIAGQTMNLDLTKTVGGPRNIAGLCTDLFLIAIRMREAEDLGAPEALRKLINYYLDLFSRNCKTLSLGDDAVEEATYALVALIDETVLSVPGACRDHWLSHPLQLDRFGHTNAGQEFFVKLEKILLQLEKKRDVAEVYFLCLSLGFEGRYKLGNAEERTAIVEDLGLRLRKLAGSSQGPLSPHSYFVEAGAQGGRGGAPIPLWMVAAACACVAAAVYGALLAVNCVAAARVAGLAGSLIGK